MKCPHCKAEGGLAWVATTATSSVNDLVKCECCGLVFTMAHYRTSFPWKKPKKTAD
jgi:hypothetical protein